MTYLDLCMRQLGLITDSREGRDKPCSYTHYQCAVNDVFQTLLLSLTINYDLNGYLMHVVNNCEL